MEIDMKFRPILQSWISLIHISWYIAFEIWIQIPHPNFQIIVIYNQLIHKSKNV